MVGADLIVHTTKQQVESLYGIFATMKRNELSIPDWLHDLWVASSSQELGTVFLRVPGGACFEVCDSCHGNCGQCSTEVALHIPPQFAVLVENNYRRPAF